MNNNWNSQLITGQNQQVFSNSIIMPNTWNNQLYTRLDYNLIIPTVWNDHIGAGINQYLVQQQFLYQCSSMHNFDLESNTRNRYTSYNLNQSSRLSCNTEQNTRSYLQPLNHQYYT